MKKQLLKERFQQLAGIKPLYTEQMAGMDDNKIELEDLDFETLKSFFPKFYQKVKFTRTQPNGEEGPYYNDSINFPNGDDSSTSIGDMNALETWKAEMEQRYGNFAILLKPEADNWFDKVEIVDDKFTKQKDDFIKGKQAWADKEMAAGRSID